MIGDGLTAIDGIGHACVQLVDVISGGRVREIIKTREKINCGPIFSPAACHVLRPRFACCGPPGPPNEG